jgi:hypothetical protein
VTHGQGVSCGASTPGTVGNWRAAYRTPKGKERTRTFTTKREARAFLAQLEGDKTRGLYVDPAGAQLRFRELADRWWAAREVELTTAANRSRLDNHVLPMWGEWPIGRIEHLDVQAWVTRLPRKLAPDTVASCHGLLSAILSTAVRSRKLGANPVTACSCRLAAARLMGSNDHPRPAPGRGPSCAPPPLPGRGGRSRRCRPALGRMRRPAAPQC